MAGYDLSDISLPDTAGLLILGITGGIAGGKSTVARMLADWGVHTIDFDILARETAAPGQPAFDEIVTFFGKEIVGQDGGLDRKRLSGIVFQDPDKRRILEGMTHPRIVTAFVKQVGALAEKDPNGIVQVVIPLLFEAHLERLVHKVLVVYVSRDTQIERLMARDRISREEACRIIDAQMPIDQKAARADFVIHNEGTPDKTKKEVDDLWRKLKTRSINGSRKEEP